MSSSEITKLESRWRENPQGLTFAPLAEAYRKMREIPRALEILTEGLGRHPDYIPASIVLGRCQLDLGNDAQAESAFARVLELDDENVIALKALAEIAERQGRLEEAGAQLRSLLAIDRSNDEARIQLARVEELRAAGPHTPPSPAESVAEAEAVPAANAESGDEPEAAAAADFATDGAGWTPAADVSEDVGFERVLEAQVGDSEMLADLEDNLHTDQEVEPLPDLVIDDVPAISADASEGPKMAGLVGEDFQAHSAEVTPLEDLAPGTASLDALDGIQGTEDIHLEPSPTNEFQTASASDDWEVSAEGAGGAEYQLSSAADELTPLETDTAEDANDFIDPLAAEYGISAEGGFPDAASVEASESREDDEVAAEFEEAVSFEPPVEFAPAAVAESLPDLEDEESEFVEPAAEEAELVEPAAEASGGDGEDADEDSLDADLIVTESMAELFLRQGHRAEALRVYRQLYRRNRDDLSLREKVDELETALADEEASAPVAEGYQAPDTTRSVAAFLSGILDARPADAPAGWTQPSGAAEPLSSEAAPAAAPGDAAPTRPASDHLSLSAVFGEEGSPVPPASPGATVPADDGISFDAFFGGDQTGGAPRPRASSRDDEDLDQFHAWLQNLKR